MATIFSRRPPSRPGIASALALSAKTISPPDSSPGVTCGSTMRRQTVKRDAPSDSAAFSTCGSSFCSEVQTGITMNGSITCTSATTTAIGVYSMRTRPMPTASKNWLTKPAGPSTRLQPKARTTTETSSGARITSRNTERQGERMRLRM